MFRYFCCTLLIVALTACGGEEDTTENPVTDPVVTDPVTDPITTLSDVTPDTFDLGEPSTASPSTSVESSSISLAGFDTPTEVSIEGGEYSINGADYVSSQGTLAPNQTIQVRLVSSATLGEATQLTLTVGGVSDTFAVTAADLTEPMLEVLYPAVESLTDEASTLLRGTVSDELSDIVSFTLRDQNGDTLSVTQNADEWTTNVDLEAGINTFTFEVQDAAGNTLTQDVIVQRRKLPISPWDVFTDAANNSIYYIDFTTKELIKVDMTTEAIAVVADMNTWETDFRLSPRPVAIQVDTEKNIAYILDQANRVIWAYNLITNTFNLIVELNDTINRARWVDMAMNDESEFLYALHQTGIVKIDIQNQTANEIHSNSSESSIALGIGNSLEDIEFLQDHLYFTTQVIGTSTFFNPNGGVLKINSNGENLEILSENEQEDVPSLSGIGGLAADKANGRLLLVGSLNAASGFNQVVFSVDLVSGSRSEIYREKLTKTEFHHIPRRAIYDNVSGRLFSISILSGDIRALDLSTFQEESFLRYRVSSGTGLRWVHSSAFLDEKNILLFDKNSKKLTKINTSTGERTSIFDNDNINLPEFFLISEIDVKNNRVLVLYNVFTDEETNAFESVIGQIDIASGKFSVLVDGINPQEGDFSLIDSMLYDAVNNSIILVTANPSDILIHSVNLDSKDVSLLYNDTMDNAFGENATYNDVYWDQKLFFTVLSRDIDAGQRESILNVFSLEPNALQPDLLVMGTEPFGEFIVSRAEFINTNKANTVSIYDTRNGDIFEINTINNVMTKVITTEDIKGPYFPDYRTRGDSVLFDSVYNRYYYHSASYVSFFAIDRESLNSAIISK